jgi:hypothetical protein
MGTNIAAAIINAIAAVFTVIKDVFGAKNTHEMKDRQLKQKETNYASEAEKAIKEKNVKKIRDLLAE